MVICLFRSLPNYYFNENPGFEFSYGGRTLCYFAINGTRISEIDGSNLGRDNSGNCPAFLKLRYEGMLLHTTYFAIIVMK
jgi:hypothetical protein